MLIGLNALKSAAKVKSPVLDAWFNTEENQPSGIVGLATQTVNSVKDMLNQVHIHKSLRKLPQQTQEVPSMPRLSGNEQKPAPNVVESPYKVLSNVLDSTSPSSKWLTSAGLLTKFMSKDCFVDMTMMSEGGVSAVLRAPDGYRRTVVCRADGTISQRITGPNGEEVVRFNNNGEPIRPTSSATAAQ